MTTPTFVAGNLQWLGIAKETTYGTPAAAPTYWIPVDSPKWDPKITPLTDTALRGMMGTQYGQAQGMRYDEVSYKTYLFPDSCFPHFLAALGVPDTVSGTTAPYTHKTSLLNTAQTGQPPSFTIWLFEGDKCEQIPGAVIADVKVTVKANELPTMDVQWQGLPSTTVTAPSNTPSSVAPMPPFTATTTIGGTSLSKYSGFSIDMKRGTKPIPALNGTQSPLAIYCGELTVTGTLDAIYQNTTDNDLSNLLSNTQPAVTLAITPQGSTNALTFQMSKVAYDSSTPSGSNSGWMTLSSNYKALMNTTDALDSKMSPIQVSLVNSQNTAY